MRYAVVRQSKATLWHSLTSDQKLNASLLPARRLDLQAVFHLKNIIRHYEPAFVTGPFTKLIANGATIFKSTIMTGATVWPVEHVKKSTLCPAL